MYTGEGIDLLMRSFWMLIIMGVLALTTRVLVAMEEPPISVATTVEDDAARQLRIYREALLQGSTDKVRVDAAVGLLLNKDSASRDLLVSSLRLPDNPGAGKAAASS